MTVRPKSPPVSETSRATVAPAASYVERGNATRERHVEAEAAHAAVLTGSGKAADALEYLERLGRTSVALEVARAEALIALGRPREALALAEQVLTREGSHARAHLAVARARFHGGETLLAIRAARRAVELAVDDADARSRLGGMLLSAGRVREALTELNRAVALDDSLPGARVNLAAALLADGRGIDAMVALRGLEDAAHLDAETTAAALEVLEIIERTERHPPARTLAEQLRARAGVPAARAGLVERRAPPPRAVLAREARELVAAARAGALESIFGRDAEVDEVIDVLLRRKKSNPLLVGPAGVGKTAIVEALAARIARGDVPARLRGARLYELSLASLIAGCAYRGDLENKLRAIVEELRGDRDAVLFVDEAHTLVGAGAPGGGLDVAEVLKPALARGEIAVIGATTDEAYDKSIARDPALARRFTVVAVAEPTPAQALAMAGPVAAELGAYHGVLFRPAAVAAAIDLSVRYLTSRRLPDKAVDVLDQAAVRAVRAGRKAVEPDDVGAVVATLARIPMQSLATRRATITGGDDLAARLRATIRGQDEACERIAEVLLVRGLGLALEGARPRGVFVFVGPPGVGKTATAIALAEAIAGAADALVRFDMSEFAERHDVARLTGAPAGYVGHEEGGRLVRALRAHPGAIVLLDEIDKAHPDAAALFLQLFDAGRATDGRGEAADARQATFVMTCNVGESGREARVGFGHRDDDGDDARAIRSRDALARVRERLSPELLSRVDAVLYFAALSRDALVEIADAQLARAQAALGAQGLALRIEPGVAAAIVAAAPTRENGARAIARGIERSVLLPAARFALARRGGEPVEVCVRAVDGRLEVS